MKKLQSFMNQLLGFVLVVSIVSPSFADVVPVLLWGGTVPANIGSNPLGKTSQVQFGEVIAKRLGKSRPPVLVFVKDNFCTEDLTQPSKSLEPLKENKSFQYIAAADSPLSVFKELPFYNQSTEKDVEQIPEGQLRIIEITDLKSVIEISDIIRNTSKNLVVALIGNFCGFRSERSKRAAEMVAENVTEPFRFATTKLLFYADRTPTLKLNGSDEIDVGDLITNVTETGDGIVGSPLIVTMKFAVPSDGGVFNATFDFEIRGDSIGYYMLSRVNMSRDDEYVATLGIRPEIYWAYNFSYHCAQMTQFVNESHGISLSFKNIQMQIDATTFGDTYDCVGFTSIPIWSAMFVTAIIAMITLWGILMIMDIRTMDRFDDPKGKTISISVTD